MKRIFLGFAALLLILVAIVIFRTLTFTSLQMKTDIAEVVAAVDPQILSEAIRFKTIAHKREMMDSSAFAGFHEYMEKTFPLLNATLEKEVVNDHSLIYRWKGKDSSKRPLILMGHIDVVPVEYSSLDQWEEPPFSGNINAGYIYGRGTIDDKGSITAIMQAVEYLLSTGFTPSRTIFLCFGHDEEIGGKSGAAAIVARLKQKNIRAWMVLDEGGTLASGIVPNIRETVALIGTSEKGYVSLELFASMPGGHSSMPEKRNALEALNDAIYRLNQNPLPNRLSVPLEGFINHIGPHLPFIQKMAFANPWLFKPLIFAEYEKSASGAALIHTTQVATVFHSGIKDNVVPARAKALINYRLLPGDVPAEILARATEIIDDTLVKVIIHDDFAIPASPVSDSKSEQFLHLSKIIRSVNKGVLVSPYLVLGATDSRYFYAISDHVFRFSPIPLSKEDLPRIHGINERVSIEGYKKSVNFYATLIQNN